MHQRMNYIITITFPVKLLIIMCQIFKIQSPQMKMTELHFKDSFFIIFFFLNQLISFLR